MNEWTCYVCKYECVPIYANPCCNCMDGDLFEPAEAMFRENVRRNQRGSTESMTHILRMMASGKGELMLTINEVIASCEKSAERYHKAFLRNKAHGGEFYQREAESDRICEEHERQLAEWLRELQERRKAPEIITCGECEHFRQEPDGEMWCGVSKGHGIDKDFFCGDAERRTE